MALVVTALPPAAAETGSGDRNSGVDVSLPEEVLSALQRDLDLTEADLQSQLANESEAVEAAEELEESLGDSFGGAWLDEAADLSVAVTDADLVDAVEDAGAAAAVVPHSEDELDDVHAALDRRERRAPRSVTGWYVDVAENTVVVETMAGDAAAAERFVARAGVDTAAVSVEVTDEQPSLFQAPYPVRGGDAYYTPQYRCSVGFSVRGGYTTAGHCGRVGTTTSGYNRVSQGTFRGSQFPGRDQAWVAVNQNWTPQPVVNNYRGGTVVVRGSQEAAVGASTCRSGSTTGWRCGRVQAKNQTVRYPQGTVYGLTRTSACAEGGDSGGAFISGNQAQGMTSGGSGNCTFGGTTFFQPLNPTLQRYGLTLVTG